jgi:hypothetical protein
MMSIEHARRKRARRASALAILRTGSISVSDALRRRPSVLLNIPIHVLLCAVPGIGPETCKKVLQRANIWPLHTLRQLSPTEIELIIEHLPKWTK